MEKSYVQACVHMEFVAPLYSDQLAEGCYFLDEHPEIALSPGDRVIFSSRAIPGNERAVGAILAWHDHPQRLDLWRAHSHTLGKRVRVGDHEGIATGLAGDGALLIDGHPVHVGEIG